MDARLLGYNAIIAMLASRALALLWVGRLEEARLDIRRATEAAAAHGDPLSRFITHLTASNLHQIEDDWERALAETDAAVLAAGALDSLGWRGPALVRMVDIHTECEAWDQVLRVCEGLEPVEVGQSFGPFMRIYEATARTQLEPGAAATALAEECLGALASEEGFDLSLAETRILRARLSRLLDGENAADSANADLDVALQNAEERSLRAYVPRIHAERAALAKACGDEAGHRHALEAAIAIAREIGASRRAARYERELV